MSEQNFIYQKLIDESDACYAKIITNSMPETEEEFWHTIEFLGFNIMWDVMTKAQNNDNLVSYGKLSEEQKNARMKLMTVEHDLMCKLTNLVSIVCTKFNLTHLVFAKHPKQNTFQKWFIKKSQEYNREITYSLLLFDGVYVVDNPQYPV